MRRPRRHFINRIRAEAGVLGIRIDRLERPGPKRRRAGTDRQRLVHLRHRLAGRPREFPGRREPRRPPLGHAPRDHVVEGPADTASHNAGPRRRRQHVRPLQLLRIPLERRLPGEALVEQARQRVHVGLRPDPAGGEPLGRQIRARSVGNAETNEVREVIARQQHVFRPNPQVHQPGGVRGVQRPRHLRDDRCGPRRLQRPPLAQQVPEAAALDQVHLDEEHPVDRAEVVHRDDVRFLQPLREAALAPEAVIEAGFGGDLGRHQLDRDHPVLDRVVRPVDLAGRARPDQRAQLVGAEPGVKPRGQSAVLSPGRIRLARRVPEFGAHLTCGGSRVRRHRAPEQAAVDGGRPGRRPRGRGDRAAGPPVDGPAVGVGQAR